MQGHGVESSLDGSMPVMLALGRLRQEDHKFKASLYYITRLCLRKKGKERGRRRKRKGRKKTILEI
jgi:hypothetical protein